MRVISVKHPPELITELGGLTNVRWIIISNNRECSQNPHTIIGKSNWVIGVHFHGTARTISTQLF